MAAFAEPRGEQLDAIVVALDVIEAAALPPRLPRRPRLAVLTRSCAIDRAVVANQDSTGSKPAGSGSVTATKRRSFVSRSVSVTRTRSPALNVVRRARRRSRRRAQTCARCGCRCRAPAGTARRRRTQPRGVEQRAGAVAREGQRPPRLPARRRDLSAIGICFDRRFGRRPLNCSRASTRSPSMATPVKSGTPPRSGGSRRRAPPSRRRSPACCPSGRSSAPPSSSARSAGSARPLPALTSELSTIAVERTFEFQNQSRYGSLSSSTCALPASGRIALAMRRRRSVDARRSTLPSRPARRAGRPARRPASDRDSRRGA